MADPATPVSEKRAFLFVTAATIAMGFAAYGLSFVLNTPLGPQIRWDINAVLIGVIATAPLTGFLWWFSNTTLGHIAAFRRAQIKFFAEIGFSFTPARIVIMAVSAGIAEELLFRGVVQSWIAGFVPVIFALVLSNVLFGMLHMRTLLYAVIAGLVGVYLGGLYVLTGNLLAPMTVHVLYDMAALEYTRRAVHRYMAEGI